MKQLELDPDIQAMLDERARTMLDFTPDHRPLNMYAIYRADIEMTADKLSAQTGHAFINAWDKAKIERPDIAAQYKGTGNGTKIIMYAKSLTTLIRAYRDCQEAKIPCDLIIDRGHIMLPHFDGNPIITALGIGPAYRDEIEHITKRYTMANKPKAN
jgi:peptidyl-tRNA hydrolase